MINYRFLFKTLILFVYLIQAETLRAQFHTIVASGNLYKVETLKEIDDEIKEEAKQRDSLKDTIDYNEIKKEIIAQFLSVSYPLKEIVITSSFGLRRDPFSKKQKSHNGIDLKAKNEEVYSMMEGEVIKTSSDKASGNYIIIKHKDYTISYCHLSMALVSKGQKVKAGDAVAISGNTGRSTGPHLHITCRYRGKYQDPSILLDYIGLVRKDAKERLEKAFLLAEK